MNRRYDRRELDEETLSLEDPLAEFLPVALYLTLDAKTMDLFFELAEQCTRHTVAFCI